MSIADFVTNSPVNPEDHFPIIRFLGRVQVTTTGATRGEWSVACICGGLYKATTPKSFVPSEEAANRLYVEHLKLAGVLRDVEIQSDTDEAQDDPDFEELEATATNYVLELARAMSSGGVTKQQVVSMLYRITKQLEEAPDE